MAPPERPLPFLKIKFENEEPEILEFLPESESEASNGALDISILKLYGVDTDAGLSYCAGDAGFYQEILNDYVNESAERISELNDMFSREDWDNYVIKVHALKSVSKTVGVNKIFEMARNLEMAGKDHDITFIESNHHDLVDEYERTAGNIGSVI